MCKIKGIGGVFIDSQDASRLEKWYDEILAVEMDPHSDGKSFFKVFFTRDAGTSILRENPVFAIKQTEGAIPAGIRVLPSICASIICSGSWRACGKKVWKSMRKFKNGNGECTPGSMTWTATASSCKKRY